MLPRHLRLTHPADFREARQHGRRWRSDLLILNTRLNGLPHNRFGFVVGRQIGQAAVRNHVKRRLRAIVWQKIPSVKNGYDVIVITRPAAAQAAYSVLMTDLGNLLILAGLVDEGQQ